MNHKYLLTIGIDASNLRRGGGLTHLIEILNVAVPESSGFKRIYIWGGSCTLNLLEDRPWLFKCAIPELDKGIFNRSFWQVFSLSREVRSKNCDVLFVPGGNYVGNFYPVVTMCRNLLPFEFKELIRYGFSISTLKLLILRLMQSRTFKRSSGLIFLTKYARDTVMKTVGLTNGTNCIIPHGINPRFYIRPKIQQAIGQYNDLKPFRVLYVSIIDQYKHQCKVVEAIYMLRKSGAPIALDLIGPSYPPALNKLKSAINTFDPDHKWISYHGPIDFDRLHSYYSQSNIGLFASSCENMPNILLELMASGLPIACSERSSMPEILDNGGVYFNPEMPEDIARAISQLVDFPKLREQLSKMSYEMAQQFSWVNCAADTLNFIYKVHQLQNKARLA